MNKRKFDHISPEWKNMFVKMQRQSELNEAMKSMSSMKINNLMVRKESDENIKK
jgi:hypothetical protein